MFGYKKINTYLRTNKGEATILNKPILDIDSAISKSSAKNDFIVYRGETSEKFGININNIKEGDIFTNKGFYSTSIDKSIANSAVDKAYKNKDQTFTFKIKILT